jgi:hypothetical protein
MADVFDGLEAIERKEERERNLLTAFIRQIAAGKYQKAAAVIRAKSLLRELSATSSAVTAGVQNTDGGQHE